MPTSNEKAELVEPEDFAPIARELAAQWTDASIEFVRNFDNLVYRIGTAPTLYLRITPGARRAHDQVRSELAVVLHTADSGIRVARPIPSRTGQLTHRAFSGSDELIACVFREAEGVAYENWCDHDSAAFFLAAGECMGRLHKSLSEFARPPDFRRFHWWDDRWSHFVDHVPTSEVRAWELLTELESWTRGLSLSDPGFGLIHGDFTIANFRIGHEGISLFDFDSCCEHWRAYELAMFLHYFGGRDLEMRRKAYHNTLEGYARGYSLPRQVIEQIPRFSQMRLLYSFLVFAEEWGFDNLTAQQEAYFEQRRRAFSRESVWAERGLTRNGK